MPRYLIIETHALIFRLADGQVIDQFGLSILILEGNLMALVVWASIEQMVALSVDFVLVGLHNQPVVEKHLKEGHSLAEVERNLIVVMEIDLAAHILVVVVHSLAEGHNQVEEHSPAEVVVHSQAEVVVHSQAEVVDKLAP